MLAELRIRGFALVEEAELRFGAGLTVLTGETGAGKSLLMDALALVMGGRADAELVRRGADRATVEAAFDLEGSRLPANLLEEMGLERGEEPVLVLRRELLAEGKGRAHANQQAVTVAGLRRLGAWLVDLHGQHEHQWLLDPSRQLDYLDRFGGYEPSLKAVSEAWSRFEEARRTAREAEAELARDRETLELRRFQAGELSAASLSAGEEIALEEERVRLAHAARLGETIARVRGWLDEEEGAAADRAGAAARELERAAALDPALGAVAGEVAAQAEGLREAASALRRYAESLEAEPGRLDQVQSRLEALRDLLRKYRVDDVAGLLEERARLEALLARSERGEEELAAARGEARAAGARLWSAARDLSARRAKAGAALALAVREELAGLGFPAVRFTVDLRPAAVLALPPEALPEEPEAYGELGERGGDAAEFLFGANVGEPEHPLRQVASGGELARIMLALKSIVAEADEVDTLVFDEIDLGVGGDAARGVGEKMRRIGARRQVLCITHLPQLAAAADRHLVVEKSVSGGRTRVKVREVRERERVDEIARMLGGSEPGEAARLHARELLAARKGLTAKASSPSMPRGERACSSAWIERLPPEQKAAGSNPARRTTHTSRSRTSRGSSHAS